MDIELVTVGAELLLGFTVDTNAAFLARALAPVGARVVRRTTVGDTREAIQDAVRLALQRTGLVVVTGGLGPTRDDVTKHAVADLFGAPLQFDPLYFDVVRRRFADLGVSMPESNRSQAEVPRGATILPNRWGTAPGLWLEGEPGVAILLPGVPREMRMLAEHEVIPRLGARAAGEAGASLTVVLSRTLRTTGIGESSLAERIGTREDQLAPAALAYLPSVTGVDLRLTVAGLPADAATRALEAAGRVLRPALGAHYYGDDDTDLAAVVLAACVHRQLRLAVAESCTGGLLGGRITAIPGASAAFVGGVIAYDDQVKVEALDVPAGLIAEHGAVSEPVVRAMVAGACRRFRAAAGVAVTGIAGPGGETPGKPVGTVWLAAQVDGHVKAVGRRFLGGREDIRARSAQSGLDLLRGLLGVPGA